MRLLAFDPSLASTGWALFRGSGDPPGSPAEAVARLSAHGSISTASAEATPARLVQIRRTVRVLCEEHGPHRVAVEIPAIPFGYGRHGGERVAAAGVADLYMATGVVLEAAASCGCPVVTVRAPSGGQWARKESRWKYLEAQAELAGVEWPRGPRGGKMPDVWDAIWIGVQALRTET